MAEGVDEDEDDEDCGEVVSSPGLKIPKSSAMLAAEIDALDKEIDEAAEAARSPNNIPAVQPLGEVVPPTVDVPDDQL